MKKIKKITGSKFVRNVAIVASGTAMAQSVGVIFTPIITRIYGPEAFGLMGTFLSLGTIAASATALAYPFAIVLPKKDSDARAIAKLSLYISLFISSLAAIMIFFGGEQLFVLIGAQAITAFAMLIPLKMLFGAWLRVAQQWFIRKKQFAKTAKVEVLQAVIINSSKTFIGFLKPVASVLIIISTLGVGLQVLMLYLSRDRVKAKTDIPDQVKESTPLLQIAKKYYDFPLYRAPVVLLDAVSTGLPILMLSAFFGPISAGFYTLGYKLLKAPTKLIGRSVSNVFYPKITKAAHDGKDLTKLIFQATLGLAAAGIIPFGLVMLFGPWIYKIIFGSEWIMAGEYARWISFFVFFNFISSPATVAIAPLGIQRGFLVYQIITITLKVAALYAGFMFFQNDVIAVALFSASGVAALIVLMYWVITTSKNFAGHERFED